MDSTTLVKSDIEEGKRVIEELNANGFPIKTVFWYYISENQEWRLFLATPFVDKNGPKDTYKKIDKILQKMRTPSDIDLTNIFVISPNDSLIKTINAFIKTGKFSDRRISKSAFGNIYIDDAYLYRTNFDKQLEEALDINLK